MIVPPVPVTTLLVVLATTPTAPVDYARDIKPIFKERCFACHGALKQQAKLRLDTAGSEDEMPAERHTQFDRESSKRAVGRLVIQFRVERTSKRVAWLAVATVVVALILSLPGVSRLIVKLMQ